MCSVASEMPTGPQHVLLSRHFYNCLRVLGETALQSGRHGLKVLHEVLFTDGILDSRSEKM